MWEISEVLYSEILCFSLFQLLIHIHFLHLKTKTNIMYYWRIYFQLNSEKGPYKRLIQNYASGSAWVLLNQMAFLIWILEQVSGNELMEQQESSAWLAREQGASLTRASASEPDGSTVTAPSLGPWCFIAPLTWKSEGNKGIKSVTWKPTRQRSLLSDKKSLFLFSLEWVGSFLKSHHPRPYGFNELIIRKVVSIKLVTLSKVKKHIAIIHYSCIYITCFI